MKFTTIALACLALPTGSAIAQSSQFLGVHDNWSAWMFVENKTKACYAYSEPVTKKPEHLDHGRVSVFVRHLRNGKIRTEASLRAGYAFAPHAVRVAIDGEAFTMIPRGKSAWLRRTEREEEFVRALTRGRTMSVEAVSKRGNKTSYTVSLKGFAATMRQVRQSCR